MTGTSISGAAVAFCGNVQAGGNRPHRHSAVRHENVADVRRCVVGGDPGAAQAGAQKRLISSEVAGFLW